MSPAKTILVRSTNWLGDAVMTTPALLRLREAKPNARIILLTASKLADLWTHHPAIDQVVTFGPKDSVWRIARRLRTERAAVALVFPNSPRAALEPFLARIPTRIGTARPWRNWFLTRPIPPRADEIRMHKRTPAEVEALIAARTGPAAKAAVPPPFPAQGHHIFQYLHLVAALGANPAAVAPQITVSDTETAAIIARFGARDQRMIIGLNPGAEYGPAKRWPVERFAEAALGIGRALDWNCQFWVLGGPGDRTLAEGLTGRIQAGAGTGAEARPTVRNLAGSTTLRELCAALKACRVLLTNDTGPMHLAAAVGTSVVVPFGSTSWRLTGPGLPGDPRHRFLDGNAPCSPCFRRECPVDFRCMQSIPPESAIQAVQDVLLFGNQDLQTRGR